MSTAKLHVSPHLQLYRAILSRNFIAQQNVKCNMAIRYDTVIYVRSKADEMASLIQRTAQKRKKRMACRATPFPNPQ